MDPKYVYIAGGTAGIAVGTVAVLDLVLRRPWTILFVIVAVIGALVLEAVTEPPDLTVTVPIS